MNITKSQADRCTTHHAACDCREYRAQEMEKALQDIINIARHELQRTGHHDPLLEDIHTIAKMALET